MPTPPLSDELAKEAADAFEAFGTKQAAADFLGIPRATLQNRLKRAAERGMMGTKPVLPGFRLTKTTAVTNEHGDVVREFIQQRPDVGPQFEIPAGHSVKGVSAYVDAENRIVGQWIKTREEPSAIDVADILAKRFETFEPAAPAVHAPAATDTDLLSLIPCNDWHVGMFAWSRETDNNWDLKIGPRVIGSAVDEAIARSPASYTAIVLGGGDLTHADNNDNRTKRSGNVLDVDGRHQKVVETAGELMVRTVDAALHKHGRVIFRNLKGNHDDETAPAIAWFLKAWYRNEPRVHVDLDQSLFFYHEHGLTMLGATHGHAAKLRDMPQIMATRRPEMWGRTRYRYAHGFHVHHKSGFVTEEGGVVAESHQAPIPQDSWHYGAGFLSGRSIQTISYHRQYGESGRVRVAILDGGPVAANDNEPQRRVA